MCKRDSRKSWWCQFYCLIHIGQSTLNHPTIYLPQTLVLPSRSYELLFVLGGHDSKTERRENQQQKNLRCFVVQEKGKTVMCVKYNETPTEQKRALQPELFFKLHFVNIIPKISRMWFTQLHSMLFCIHIRTHYK